MEKVESNNSEKITDENKTPVEEHVDGNDNTSVEKNSTDKKDEEKKADDNKSVDASPELLEKIKNQIEFYFGDVNLQRDKFLIEQIKLDEGWIPMTIMLQFKLLASISNDAETILKALENSDLMEISDNKKKIRRRPDKPLPLYNEEYRRAQQARTVYLKPFPQDTKLDQLKEFVKDFGIVENIVMRKYKDENQKLQFKGSIFVQFKNLDDAKALVAKESVSYNGTELIKMLSEDYTLMKAKERQEKKHKGGDSKGKKNDQEEEKEDDEEKSELPKGAVLHFTVDEPKDIIWESIKQSFIELEAKIMFVDYKNGQKTGWIRFQGKDSAQPLLEKLTDKKIKIKDSEITFQLLEGEEEEEYLKKVKKELNDNNKKPLKSRKNRGKKGGFRKGKKRGGSPVQDDVAAKKTAK